MTQLGREVGDSGADLASLTALMLIDYDNLDQLRDAQDAGRFSFLISRMVNSYLDAVILDKNIRRLLLRLYGGWDNDGTLTQQGSRLLQMISSADPFPIIRDGQVISGRAELALGPIHRPGLTLSNTFRRRRGAIRIRRDPNFTHESCKNDRECAARQLAKWTSRGSRLCPTAACSATSSEAFLVSEQKMVDTLLTVDMLHALHFDGYASVGLVSNDTDFVPPLLHVAEIAVGARTVLLMSERWEQGVLDMLQDVGVLVIGVEGV